MLPRGLVLVTGPTGSGKSTTLAAMIDEVNRNRTDHILTIEDPIEFVHRHKRCIVNQREIGVDAISFGEALRAALRQDPDVILVGEMRDLETIGTALTAAETGHLVLGTLHTQSAPGTVDRIIDVFPAEQQEQVRIMLAGSLQGIVTQALLPTADGDGRVAALEILLPDDATRNLIRQGKVEQIYTIMQTATSRGMMTMEQSLAKLVLSRVITKGDRAWLLEPPRPARRLARTRRLRRDRERIARRPEGDGMSDEKNTPIWKKEISFRRKPDEGTAESAPGSASLWKKEISFGKNAKDADADGVSSADADVVVEPDVAFESAPTVDLDLIAKYAPLPEPVAPPAARSRSARHRSSRLRSRTPRLTTPRLSMIG